MPTKEELERELAAAHDRIAELEAGAAPAPGAPAARPRPQRPAGEDGKPILSAGELDDLRNAGVTTSPFDGSELNALDEGVEPANPRARRAAEEGQRRARARAGAQTDAAGQPAAGE